jgi:hypothetical protein
LACGLAGLGLSLPYVHAAAPEQQTRGNASLVVKVRGLPGGVPVNVVVKGPQRFQKTLSHSARLRALPPGRYQILVRPTVITHSRKGVSAGSRAFAAKRTVKVRARAGKVARATATYGTIRSSQVLVLKTNPRMVVGPKRNPTAIVPPGSIAKQVRKGRILTSEPSAKLPAGLFHRVTGITKKGDRTYAQLAPASLWEVFPALDLTATVPLSQTFAMAGSAHASGFDDVDLTFGKTLIPKLLEASCGGPPTGWSLSPTGSLHSWVNSDLHRRYLALPYGRLTLTVQGTVGFDSTIPTGAHCGITLKGPSLQAAIIVFGVPVPIEGGADLNIDIQTDAPISASASATVKATTGIDFNGRKSAPILELSQTASGSAKATAGSLSIGPEFQAGFGIDGVNAHLSIEPQIAAKASRTSCEIDVGLVAGVGLDILGFHPSYLPIKPSAPVYRCPLPDGVFFDGAPGSGPPPATLGPYTMTRFGTDPQELGEVKGVVDPAGSLGFPETLDHQLVGEGWATWSNGYQGDVYISGDANKATVDLPAGTRAFYLYAEPNLFADFTVTATSSEGTTSGPVTVYGDSGARYFGFYTTGSKTLSRITVGAEDRVAVGEFGISR